MHKKFTLKAMIVAFTVLLSVIGKVNAQDAGAAANTQKVQPAQNSNLPAVGDNTTPLPVSTKPLVHVINNLNKITPEVQSPAQNGVPIPDKSAIATPGGQTKVAEEKKSPDTPTTTAPPQKN